MKIDRDLIEYIVADGNRISRGVHSMQSAIIQAIQYVSLGAQEDLVTLRSAANAASRLRYAANKYCAAASMILGATAHLSGRSVASVVREACEKLMISSYVDGIDVVEVFSDTATNRATSSLHSLSFLLETCQDGLDSVLEDVPHVGRILIECALALQEKVNEIEAE